MLKLDVNRRPDNPSYADLEARYNILVDRVEEIGMALSCDLPSKNPYEKGTIEHHIYELRTRVTFSELPKDVDEGIFVATVKDNEPPLDYSGQLYDAFVNVYGEKPNVNFIVLQDNLSLEFRSDEELEKIGLQRVKNEG